MTSGIFFKNWKSAWPGASREPGGGGGSEQNILLFQVRKHLKCLCFHRIMLESDPQGVALALVAQAKLLRVRIGMALKVTLPASHQ